MEEGRVWPICHSCSQLTRHHWFAKVHTRLQPKFPIIFMNYSCVSLPGLTVKIYNLDQEINIYAFHICALHPDAQKNCFKKKY